MKLPADKSPGYARSDGAAGPLRSAAPLPPPGPGSQQARPSSGRAPAAPGPHLSMAAAPARLGPGSALPPPPAPARGPEGQRRLPPAPSMPRPPGEARLEPRAAGERRGRPSPLCSALLCSVKQTDPRSLNLSGADWTRKAFHTLGWSRPWQRRVCFHRVANAWLFLSRFSQCESGYWLQC